MNAKLSDRQERAYAYYCWTNQPDQLVCGPDYKWSLTLAGLLEAAK